MKDFRISPLILVALIAILPVGVAHAETFREFADGLIEIMNLIIPTLVVAGLVLYFWQIMKGVLNQDSKTAQKNFREYIGWGLIGLFVMVSIWGILQILQNTFLSGGGRSSGGDYIESDCMPGDLGCGLDSL